MVDVHTHTLRRVDWGDEYKRNWSRDYGQDWPEPNPDDYGAKMLAAGVSAAVIFGIRASFAGVKTPHRAVLEFCRQVATTTIPFMALDVNDADWERQFDEGVELGFQGIKLYPVMAVFDPSDRAFDPFYRKAERLQLPILWHMGASLSSPGDLNYSHPLLIDKVARRFPDLKQVIAHMGHPWQRETVQVLRKNRQVFADISGFWTRPMDGYLALVNAQEWQVTDKLLFGSDYPIWTPQQTIDGLYGLTNLGPVELPRVESATIDRIISNDVLALLGLRKEKIANV